jgi:hypothetical protein
VADQHHRLGVGALDVASQPRRDPEDLEEAGRDLHPEEALGLVAGGTLDVRAHVGGDPADAVHRLAVVEEVGRRDRELRIRRRALEHPHQAVGLWVRQRLEQHAADHRKQRAGGADAEPQRHHRDQRHRGILAQRPQGEP